MKLTIHGPNLIDQTKGTFHVHTARCRDNKVEVTANGSELPYTGDFATVEDVAEFIYSDQIAEAEGELEYLAKNPDEAAKLGYTDERIAAGVDLNGYIADFHFAPCTAKLPNRADKPARKGPSEADIKAATDQLVKELESPQMAQALADADELAKPARKPRKKATPAPAADEPKVTFKDAAEKVLRNADGPMKVKAIAEIAVPLVRPVTDRQDPGRDARRAPDHRRQQGRPVRQDRARHLRRPRDQPQGRRQAPRAAQAARQEGGRHELTPATSRLENAPGNPGRFSLCAQPPAPPRPWRAVRARVTLPTSPAPPSTGSSPDRRSGA